MKNEPRIKNQLKAMSYKLKAKNGVTLIEILLYISLAAVILLSVTMFLSVLLQSRVKNQTIAEVEQQGAQVLQIFSQTARNSQGIILPEAGGSGPVVLLAVSDIEKTPTVFGLSDIGSTINISEGTDPPIPLTSSRVKASNLTFQNLSRADTPGTIRIQFTLSHTNPSKRNEFEYKKTFYGSATIRKVIPTTPTEADSLKVDTSGASIGGAGNRDLRGIVLENIGSADITIYTITVSWTNSSRRIRQIIIGGTTVWSRTGPGAPSGEQPSGTELDIEDTTITQGAGVINIDRFRFNNNMKGNTFEIIFTMADGSQKVVLDISP